MKFKIQAGGEIDLLTKDELGGMLDDKIADFDRTLSEGIRFSKATVSALSTVLRYLQVPTLTSATPVGTGGTFAAGTYYYVIAVGNTTGVTAVSNEVNATVVLNGSVALAWPAVDPNATTIKIFRGTTPGGENTLVATIASNNTGYTDTNVGGASGLPTGPVVVSSLPTTPAYPGGYIMLESARPEPGYVWQISNLTYFNLSASGADLFFDDPQPSNVVYAGLLNSGTTQVADNCFIVPGGRQIGIGFKAAVTNAAINLFYKEVPIRDIGKL